MALNIPGGLPNAAVVGAEGVSLAAAVVPSLAGRSVTSYAQSFMIAAIVISVVGVATAIFSSSIFMGVGFALAGIVSIVGVFVAQSAFEGEQLQQSIAQLNRQNAFLDDQRIKLDAAAKVLQGENDRLKLAQESLDVKCKELEGENITIRKIASDLRVSLEGMTAVNGSLKTNRSEFVSQIARLQEHVSEAKTTLQTFLATNRELSSNIGFFAQAIANLEAAAELIRKSIADLETEIGAGLPSLEAHVTLARGISDYIHSRVETQRESQSAAIDAYRQEVANLRTHIETLQGYIRDLEKINAGFALQIQDCQSIEQLQAGHREALSALIKTLEEGSSRFAQERELCRVEALRLQSTFTEFAQTTDALVLPFGPLLQRLDASDSAKLKEALI